jgi:hypothetical protein
MTNVNFKTISTSRYASGSDSSHYNLPLIPWFRSSGQPADYPNQFIPHIGTKHTFVSNIDASSYNYIYNKTDPFWPEEDKLDNGFSLQSPRVVGERSFNYRIDAGKGHWMPCPIFQTASWYWAKDAPGAVWYMKHFALSLKNVKTNETKIWGASMDNTSGQSRVMKILDTDEVRAMGPDWFVYGVIFNLKRDYTSDLTEPKARLVDFRLGYLCDGVGAYHRLVVPKNMTWGDFTYVFNSGQMKYEPI